MKELFNKPADMLAVFAAFQIAATQGESDTAQGLLDEHPRLASHRDTGGNNILHIAASMRDGGKTLEKALSMNSDTHAQNTRGETPLLLAAVTGDGGGISVLLKAGALLHAFDNEGHNATMRAIRSGNLDAATVLLLAGGLVDSEDPAVEKQIDVAWEKILPDFCKALDAQQKRQTTAETLSLKKAKAERIKAAVTQGASTARVLKTASFSKKPVA